MLIDKIIQRGNTYKEWIGIVETDFFRGGRTLEDQIRAADTGHLRCFGPSDSNDPDESNLTPSEQQARAALTDEGWDIFKKIVRAARKTKSCTVLRASGRLSRIVWYVSQAGTINWTVTGELSGVSPNIAKRDIDLLANRSGSWPLVRTSRDEQKHGAAAVYSRVDQLLSVIPKRIAGRRVVSSQFKCEGWPLHAD